MQTKKKSTRKKIIAVLAGVAVAAAVSASASTLGGAFAHGVGADTGSAGSVLTEGVNVEWDTAYAEGGYVVNTVTLTTNEGETIPAAADVALTVLGNDAGDPAAAATPLTELTEDVTTATDSVVWTGTSISAHKITGVAVVIDGNAVTATVD